MQCCIVCCTRCIVPGNLCRCTGYRPIVDGFRQFTQVGSLFLLKALMYKFIWFNHNVVDMVDVVMFYLVIIADATHDFLSGDHKDLLKWVELNWIGLQAWSLPALYTCSSAWHVSSSRQFACIVPLLQRAFYLPYTSAPAGSLSALCVCSSRQSAHYIYVCSDRQVTCLTKQLRSIGIAGLVRQARQTVMYLLWQAGSLMYLLRQAGSLMYLVRQAGSLMYLLG